MQFEGEYGDYPGKITTDARRLDVTEEIWMGKLGDGGVKREILPNFAG